MKSVSGYNLVCATERRAMSRGLLCGLICLALIAFTATSAQAIPRTWDGGGADSRWTNSLNWNPDGTPGADVLIIDGAFTVDMLGLGSGFLPSGVTVTLTNGATLTISSGVCRINGTGLINVSSNCTLNSYWAMYQGSMSFQNGAKWPSGDWELNGTNVFSFKLGPAGFTKLTPTTLRWDGTKKFTQQIWNVDMANYTGGPTNIILVDFGSASDASMTASNFLSQATRNVTNPGIYTGSTIIYDPVQVAFVLKVQVAPYTPPIADFVWDGGGGDTNWATAANWDPDILPSSGFTVAIATNVTVDYTSVGQYMAAYNLTLTNGAGLYSSGTIRLNGATINVASNSRLTGGWWDLSSGNINFQNGAIANSSQWQLGGVNRFSFKLGAAGFTTLTPGTLWGSGVAATISNATFIADMADYAGGGGIITLVDYVTDNFGFSNTLFQTAPLIVTNTDGYIANLQWNNAAKSVELNVTGVPVYYWDNDGTTAGFGATASGTWAVPTTGTALQGWSRDAAGSTLPTDIATSTRSSVNFGYGANGLGAGTIAVNSSVTNGNMTFASTSGTIVLSGGTIVLTPTATITVSNSSDTISSVLAGAATSLTKAGPGTLILAGTNTYVGATTISNGTLLVNGLTTNSAMTVVTNGTLGGTGKVGSVTVNAGGAITANGTNTVGTLSATNLTVSENAVIYWNYDATAGTADVINVTGSLTLPTNVTVHVSGTGELPNNGLMFSSTLPLAGATDLINWSISGPGVGRTTFAVRVGNSVYFKTSSGTIITLQ